jgi:ABC-type uncharacterized transport system permease subunit
MQPAFRSKFFNAKFVSMAIPVLAILIALLVGGLLIAFAGINPMKAYGYMIKGSLGNTYGIGETLSRFIPLLFCALGFSFAFKSGVYNAGAEGQLYMGALGALLAGAYVKGLPAIIHIPLVLFCGFVAGAIWCYIAGFLRIKFGSNELINTLMLNYIALYLVDLLLKGILKDPGSVNDQSRVIGETAKLSYIMPGTRLHSGLFIALLAAYFFYYFFWRTPQGYQLRTIGTNPKAAVYAGMNIFTGTSLAFIISGGLAGLGGAVELMGSQHRLMMGFSPGYGFDGIGAAVMGRHSAGGIVLTSLLFAIIRVGAGAMQRGVGVPFPLLSVIQGLIIIMIIASSYLTEKLSANVIGGRA